MPAQNRHRLFGLFAAASLLAVATFPLLAHQVDPTGASSPALATSAVMATGTVAEMIVENQVSGVTLRYLALRSDEGQTVALTGAGLDLLSSGTRVTATGSLTGNVMTVRSVSILPAARVAGNAGAPAPSQKQVQGTLVVFHKDYFAQGRGEYGLGVHDGATQMTPLNMAVIPDALRPGMTVSVSGTTAADGVSLDASQITILGLPPVPATGVAATPTTNNVLVMPIKFTDSPASDPFTPSQVDQVMRTNAGSVAAYYNEVSYGQQQLNITVACATAPLPTGCATHTAAGGWLLSSSTTPASCDFTTIGNLADQAATAAGYNIADYNNRFYVLPGLSCGWAGLAYVGYPYQAWSNAYNVLWVYGHELGHNFTLWHAGSLNCSPQVIGGGCSVNEYGDRFDIMGNNSNTNEQMHFNAMQKAVLNWIPASSVVTHTSGTATYTLSPLESGGQATYAVKIPVASDVNRTYWIEYRQPIGFDSGIAAYPNNGAQIRVANPFDYPCTSCGGDDTELLDMTPGSAGGSFDAALVAGQSFIDSTYGIHVTVNSATASALTVTVSIGGGQTTSATGLASSANPSVLGASVTFTATVNGSAPTGTVAFTADSTTLTGCGSVTLPTGSANSKSATCSTASLGAGTHSIVASYAGDASNSGSTSPALSQLVNAGSEVVWMEDSVPAGAVMGSDGGDAWNWISSNPPPYAGALANQSLLAGGEHQHYFYSATATLTVAVGDTLFAYVYLDPANPPSEIMLQWNDGSWEHRAYWGANLIGWWGTDSTVSRRYIGALPAAGQWVRLAVPAAQVGLEGRTLNGMAFTLYGGRATWDHAGKSSGGSSTTTTMLGSSANPSLVGASVTFTATVNGSAPTGTVAFTADSTTLTGCGSVTLPTGSANSKSATCSTASLGAGTHSIVASYAGDASNSGSTSPALSQLVNAGSEVVWMEDSVPAGAVMGSDGGDAWNWISSNPPPYAGALANQSLLAGGEHQHYFYSATATLTVAVGDTLFAYVYLDPANPPSEIMLQWNDGSWEHRAYWGANLIGWWGTDSTVSRRYIGALPAAGQWVRLAVPAAQVGLEGRTLNGMAFTLYGGRATWDHAGKSSGGSSTTTTMLGSSANPSLVGASVTFTATVNGSAPTGTVAFTADSTTLTGCGSVTLPTGSANSKSATCSTASLGAGTHSIVASYAGDASNSGSTSPALSQLVNAGSEVVWMEDSVPAGAVMGSDGGDAWNWISSNPPPYAGALANQSLLAGGEHQHYFYSATATLTVAVGDTLFAYVYLDPANPPSEIMLQWNDGSWEHRAYWGANLIGWWGTDSTVSRRYIGALPAAGQWVRLAVPAAQVGLEGRTLNGMAFTLYGGRATWDHAGTSSAGS